MSGITEQQIADLAETVEAAAGGFGKGCPFRNARAQELREHRKMRKLLAAPGRIRWTGGDRIDRRVKEP